MPEILQKIPPVPAFFSRILKIIFVLAAVFLVFWLSLLIIPFKPLNRFINRPCSTRFYDRNGILLQISSVDDGLRREWTDLEKIPQSVQQAFIEAEDKNFYRHHGVDILAIFRALGQNTRAQSRVSGASTITMQLARMVVPRQSANVTLWQKMKETFNALRIEAKLSKKQILELYLNNVPFGFRTEGVTSAARNFYGVQLHQLSFEQIETLALFPRRPATYIQKVPGAAVFEYPNNAPHFVNFVKNLYAGNLGGNFQIDLTGKKTGANAKKANYTRLPPDLYLSIDLPLTEECRSRLFQTSLDYKTARINDGAAFLIDNITGEILVWCGGTDFDRADNGQVDGVLARNQTGSSTKPFLYAAALQNGFYPASVLPDVPMDFGTDQVYVPQNFNNRFNGPQLFRTCLASSLNIPAVFLLYRLGVDQYCRVLDSLGLFSIKNQRENLGLSLALGAGEVSLYELGRAFSVFSRDGTVPKLTIFAQKPGYKTGVLSEVFTKDTSRIVCNMLSDYDARALGFGFSKIFDTPYPAIFKTGTSNQFQNIVALGATPRYTAAVWMGNLSGETVIGETGSSIPAKIVRFLLDSLQKKGEKPEFMPPEQFEKRRICALSGMGAGKSCPAATAEYVRKGEKIEKCSWHYIDAGGKVQVKYPNEYQRWLGGKNMNGELKFEGRFRFLYPLNGAVFVYDSSLSRNEQQLRIDLLGGNEETAELFCDGVSIGIKSRPFSWYLPLNPGVHQLQAYCGTATDAITITIK
ncbi:MAG: transglycosylase domain-containing protein [Treponemataceae bacterium]|nr:transglycosylase domain-containing protein [Treponemataceae bacterium]